MLKFFLCLSVFLSTALSSAQEAEPEPCQCIGAIKDYDPAKGFYFDRVTGSFFNKTISARFSCTYFCKGKDGNDARISYIHEESHPGGKSSGPEHAKWFICDNSIGRFIPRHDLMGRLLYYDTIAYGPFDAINGPRPEFRAWAASEKCELTQRSHSRMTEPWDLIAE